MAIKPKKVISSRGEIGVGGGNRGASSGGNVIKKEVMLKKKAAVKPKTTVKIKSGGDIQPASIKKTIASNPANVGRAPSPDRVKWDLETAKLYARKGKTVKINSAPRRTSGNK
jgi:hypothetical protein